MADDIAVLIVTLAMGAVPFLIAVLIRMRGPHGIIKGVDWQRVSDPHALGQFIAALNTVIGALIAMLGVTLFALRDATSLREAVAASFLIAIGLCAAALVVGKRRHQDQPARRWHERR